MFHIFSKRGYGRIGFLKVPWASSGGLVKNPPVVQEPPGDAGSIPGSGRSPGEGHGNPLQYSCLENLWTEEPGRLTVRRVAKSQTIEVI